MLATLLRRGAAAAAVVALAAARLSAHDVAPLAIQMRPDTFSQIRVTDPSGCAATITATSTDPTVVTVYAADMVKADGSLLPGGGATITVPNRVDQIFLVVATPAALAQKTAAINICWIGEDFGGAGPCQENNCSPFFPHAVAITVDPNAKNAGSNVFCGIFGDPVTTVEGEQTLDEEPDLRWKGPMTLRMRRHFSSRSVSEGFPNGRLGPNWRHDYEWVLRDRGGGKEIVAPDGRLFRFDQGPFDTTWTLTSGKEYPAELIDGAGGTFKLRDGRDDLVYTFDSAGVLTKIEDGKGNALTLAYTSGRLASVSDGLGRTLTFVYDGSGRLVSVSDGSRTVSYAYDGSGRLVSFTDAMGKVTSYAYDAAQPAQALLVAKTRPEGNVPWTQVYDSNKRVVSQTDALARTFGLSFDTANGRTTTTDPASATQVHTHVGNRLTDLQLENGKSAALTYDTSGRQSQIVDRLGGRTSWTWDSNAMRVQTRTDANGGVTRLTWTPRVQLGFQFHDLTRVVFPDGTTENYSYDANGNVTSRTDATGGAWSRTYGTRGEVLTITDPDGTSWHYTWGPDFSCDSATDPAGNQTDYLYDAWDRLVAVMLPDGSILSATWDDCDRLTSVTDEDGEETDFAWDDNGNLVAVMLPDGAIWSYAYDAMDRLIAVTDPDGNPASFTRDAYGRLAGATNAAGETLAVTWSAAGNVSSITDGNGAHTTFGFDDEDLPGAVIDEGGENWSFVTDATGHLTRSTSPGGRLRVLVRDLLSRPVARFDGVGNRTDLGYDGFGRLSRISVPAVGATTNLDRDGRGRLNGVMRGAAEWRIGRDATGAADQYIDPLGRTITSTLDERGRPIHADFPGALGSVDVTWSASGRLTRALFSDLLDVQYTYDQVGRPLTTNGVTLVRDAKGAVIDSNGIGLTRDELSRITKLSFGGGHDVDYAYDPGGRLTTATDWLGGVTTFGYDAAGREDELTFPNGVNVMRAFDADGLLLRITTTAPGGATLGDLQFTRDAEGRIASATRMQPVVGVPTVGSSTHTFDLAGQDSAFTYDLLGRRTGDGTRTFTYNLANQLTGAVDGAESYAFGWNGFGNVDTLQSTSVNGSFTWNYGTRNPSIAKVQQGGVDVVCFVPRPDGRLLYGIDVDDDARTFFHFDEGGNTIFTTDDAAAIVNAYAWSPTGVLLARTGPTPVYKFSELLLEAEEFAANVGVGTAVGERVYEALSASMLQPNRSIEILARPIETPYVQGQVYRTATLELRSAEPRLFPQIPGGSGDSTNRPNFSSPIQVTPVGDPPHRTDGWGKCSNCHPKGLTDNVTWAFAAGPRRTLPLGAGSHFSADDPVSNASPGGEYVRVCEVVAPSPPLPFVFLASTESPFRIRFDTGPPKLDDEQKRNLRRAVLKLQVETRLKQVEAQFGFLFAFLTPQGAEEIADRFDDLTKQLEEAGVSDAHKKMTDWLLGN